MCTCTCSAAAVWDACCTPHKGTSKNLPPLFSDLFRTCMRPVSFVPCALNVADPCVSGVNLKPSIRERRGSPSHEKELFQEDHHNSRPVQDSP